MFTTHRMAERHLDPLLEQDRQSWHFVEQDAHFPWLYVSLARRLNEESIIDMVMVAEIPTFELFLDQTNENFWIEGVQLVSPGWMNGTKGWLMEPLVSINEKCTGKHRTYIYTVQEGKQYSYPPTTAPDATAASRIVFSANASQR